MLETDQVKMEGRMAIEQVKQQSTLRAAQLRAQTELQKQVMSSQEGVGKLDVKRNEATVKQQDADTRTLIAGKSPGGFRWDDPENTPDKYLDGTVTKGNFFNPGGLLGKRTV